MAPQRAMEKSKIDLSDFFLVQPQELLQFCAATIYMLPFAICSKRKVNDGKINNLMSFWEGVIGC